MRGHEIKRNNPSHDKPGTRRRSWEGVIALCLVPLLAVRGSAYDPAEDPAVNPPVLFATAPSDAAAIADDETIVRHLRADPASLNPLLMSSGHEMAVKAMLFDEPVVLGPQMEWMLNPNMADAYVEAEDHLSAELKLKPDLSWHDGAPVTADDIVFSWQMIQDQRVPVVRAPLGVDQIADCTAGDPLTVRFRFARALPTNRWAIRFPIIPRHIYARGYANDPTLSESAYHAWANRNPVGNGPYRFVEWQAGHRMVLDRWDGYRGDKPHFARMVFRIVPDGHAALLMFTRGELDEMPLTSNQFVSQTTDSRFSGVGVKAWAEQATVYCIGWNMDGSNPFFGDVRVRRAMCHALNIPLIIKRVYDNLYPQAKGIFPPGSWAHNPDVKPFAFSRDRAARLLDEAGWRIDPDSGWRCKTVEGPDGTAQRVPLSFRLAYAQESMTSPQVAAILQQDLKHVGVEMKLQALEYLTLKQRVFTHDFQAVVWAWTAEAEPDNARHLFYSTAAEGGQNFVSYANPEVDALFDAGRRSFDVGERRKCYQRLARLIYEDAPYTFMINAPSLWAFQKRIRGVHLSPVGPTGFYPGARGWWVPAGAAIRTPR